MLISKQKVRLKVPKQREIFYTNYLASLKNKRESIKKKRLYISQQKDELYRSTRLEGPIANGSIKYLTYVESIRIYENKSARDQATYHQKSYPRLGNVSDYAEQL